MRRRKNTAHGWKNDATWTIASAIENNEALRETMVNEASLAISKAIEGGAKSRRDAMDSATRNLAWSMRNRFNAVHDRVSSAAYTILRHAKVPKDELDIGGLLLLLARVSVESDVDWKEIARHYVSAFEG